MLTEMNRLCRRLLVCLLKGNNSSCSLQDNQCTCDVMFWRVRLTGVAVVRQQVTPFVRYVPTDNFRYFAVIKFRDFEISPVWF